MAAKPSDAAKGRPQAAREAAPELSLDRIVLTAVALLDAEGLSGLTMRRLADRLGAGAMSLYWHVAGKEEVLDLALDAVLGYGEVQAAAQGNWRAEVIQMLEEWRATMLRHPWSAALLPRRALGPNMLGRLERLAKALSVAGVAEADLNAAIWSLWNYVMGATVTRVSFGLSDADMTAGQERLAGHYPTIEASRLLLDSDWDGAFRKGLAFLLDSLGKER